MLLGKFVLSQFSSGKTGNDRGNKYRWIRQKQRAVCWPSSPFSMVPQPAPRRPFAPQDEDRRPLNSGISQNISWPPLKYLFYKTWRQEQSSPSPSSLFRCNRRLHVLSHFYDFPTVCCFLASGWDSDLKHDLLSLQGL